MFSALHRREFSSALSGLWAVSMTPEQRASGFFCCGVRHLVPWNLSAWHGSSHGEVLHTSSSQRVQHLLSLVLSSWMLTILCCCSLSLFSQSDTWKNKYSWVKTLPKSLTAVGSWALLQHLSHEARQRFLCAMFDRCWKKVKTEATVREGQAPPWPDLCRKLSFATSMRRVPPFHLDLFNTVKPTETTNRTCKNPLKDDLTTTLVSMMTNKGDKDL